MKKWLTVALVIVITHLAAFTGLADAKKHLPTNGGCDLTISKFVEGPQPISGQPAAFAIAITNVGSGNCVLPLNTVVVTDTLPSGTTLIGTQAQPGWSCPNNPPVTCKNLPLTLGASQSSTVVLIRVNVSVPFSNYPKVPMKNCASITVSNPPDSNLANNTFCLAFYVTQPQP
jgi:uncharacterized repeat protein (TIGR01451 family)